MILCRREEAKKARLQRAREYEEAQWAQMDAEEDGASDSGEELVEDDLYCVACDKLFRSENALANHERYCLHQRTFHPILINFDPRLLSLQQCFEQARCSASSHQLLNHCEYRSRHHVIDSLVSKNKSFMCS